MTRMSPVVHFEMPAEDRTRMASFYEKAFGWKTQMLGPEMGDYVLVSHARCARTPKVVRFNATTLWHFDAAEWAPSTASELGHSAMSAQCPLWIAFRTQVRHLPRSERRHTPDEFAAVIKANAGPRLFVPLISRLNHE